MLNANMMQNIHDYTDNVKCANVRFVQAMCRRVPCSGKVQCAVMRLVQTMCRHVPCSGNVQCAVMRLAQAMCRQCVLAGRYSTRCDASKIRGPYIFQFHRRIQMGVRGVITVRKADGAWISSRNASKARICICARTILRHAHA